jgi:hypothetical protein
MSTKNFRRGFSGINDLRNTLKDANILQGDFVRANKKGADTSSIVRRISDTYKSFFDKTDDMIKNGTKLQAKKADAFIEKGYEKAMNALKKGISDYFPDEVMERDALGGKSRLQRAADKTAKAPNNANTKPIDALVDDVVEAGKKGAKDIAKAAEDAVKDATKAVKNVKDAVDNIGKVFVNGYTKASGAVVESYWRSPPPAGMGKGDSMGAKNNKAMLDKAKDAKPKATPKPDPKPTPTPKPKTPKFAPLTKDMSDAIAKFNKTKGYLKSLEYELERFNGEIPQMWVDRLTKGYDNAVKAADDAIKILPKSEAAKLKLELDDVLKSAVKDAELGFSKYGTAGYKPSVPVPDKIVSAGKKMAGDQIKITWTDRGDNLTKAIKASSDATGKVSEEMLASRLNALATKPGMKDFAKTLTDAEKAGLNARGITISGGKFKAPSFSDFDSVLDTINTLEKAGNTAIKDSADDLAKVGITQSAKTGKWAMTSKALGAAGKMLPVVAGVLEAKDRLDAGKDPGEATRGAILTTLASIAGSAIGGATAGSVIPGAGTVGGFIFGLIGGVGGAVIGGWGSDRIDENVPGTRNEELIKDAIGKIKKRRK